MIDDLHDQTEKWCPEQGKYLNMYDEIHNYFVWQWGCGDVEPHNFEANTIEEARHVIQTVIKDQAKTVGSTVTFDPERKIVMFYPCSSIPDNWVWQHRPGLVTFAPSTLSPTLMNLEAERISKEFEEAAKPKSMLTQLKAYFLQ